MAKWVVTYILAIRNRTQHSNKFSAKIFEKAGLLYCFTPFDSEHTSPEMEIFNGIFSRGF
jgi:hypothetical protein